MQNLERGDVIGFNDGKAREEVMARLENIVWTRNILPSGAVSTLNKPQLIEDLATYGFVKEEYKLSGHNKPPRTKL